MLPLGPSKLSSVVDRLTSSATTSIDSASAIVFRIGFGAIMAAWAWDYLAIGRVTQLYVEPRFHFTYLWFDWVQPWSGSGMYIHFVVLIVLALCIASGFLYRLTSTLFALGYTYFFLLDRTNYQNHYYLVCLISWWLPFLPLNRSVSVDAFLTPKLRSNTMPTWVLWVLRFHIGIPYFFGGIAKLNADWFLGEPMRSMLASKNGLPIVGYWFTWEPLVLMFTWGGLLFDLAIVPLLLWKKTRAAAYVLCVGFHLTNAVLFNIHIFPWFMIFATLLFFDPSWPRKILGGLPVEIPDTRVQKWGVLSNGMRLGFVLAGLYGLFHCTWPLRHRVLEGDASWTEQSHHFAWRMMLRGKTVVLGYGITDKVTGITVDGKINRFLSKEQSDKLGRNPDMILHLAHFLGEQYRSETGHDAEVHALVYASLNGRKPELFIDPNVDLMSIPRGSSIRGWVMPQSEPMPATPWTVPVDQWRQHVPVPELRFLKPNRAANESGQEKK
jgi:vitamin K-dependent gamma-carboxylase